MLSDYAMGLQVDKKNYIVKLKLTNGLDPYSISEFKLPLDNLPKITSATICDFLIFRVSAKTQMEIRAYKCLDSFAHLACGWINEMKATAVGNNFLIVSKVMHSQRVSEPALRPWILISPKGDILATHCNCIAGLGEACSHVAAVLFALEFAGKEPISVTDVLAYWMQPKSKHNFYKKIVDIEFSVPISHKVSQPEKKTMSTLKWTPTLSEKEVEDFLKDYQADGGVSVLQNFFLETPTKDSLLMTNLYNADHENLSLCELRSLAENVRIEISTEEEKNIEKKTRKQSKCMAWFLLRAGRITASNFRAVCHTNIQKPSISLLKRISYPHLNKRTFKAGIYGCTHEHEGIKALETYHNKMCTSHPHISIAKCGLYFNKSYPFFAASPDGMFNCNSCGGNCCVEIKCPYCARDSSVAEIIETRKTCITQQNGVQMLDNNHQYFYQVQMQMALTKTNFCFFVMWSHDDFYWEKVAFDCDFWEKNKDIALEFHQKVVLPELMAKWYTKRESFDVRTNDLPNEQTILDQVEEVFCHCRKPDDGETMVLCANKKCAVRWYHLACLNLKKKISKKWLCQLCCKK